MAILSAKTTEKFDAAAMKGVTQVLGSSNAAAIGGSGKRKTKPYALAVPHDVYTLALKDFGNELSGAKRTSLRYLVFSGSRAVAAVELQRSSRSKAPKLSHINQGSLVSASLTALEFAERLPVTKKTDFELRLLQIPAIQAIALWLHGKKGDLLIPLDHELNESTGGTALAELLKPRKFFSSLRAEAELVLGFDDAPGRTVEHTLTQPTRSSAAMKTGTKKAKKTIAMSPKKVVAGKEKKSAAKSATKTVTKTAKKSAAKSVKKTKVKKSSAQSTARMAKGARAAIAAVTPDMTKILVRPTESFRNSSRQEKIRKMTDLLNQCLTAAANLGVTIGTHVKIDVARTELSPLKVSVRNPAFCTLQLSVPDLDILGDELVPGFSDQARALANDLADSGQAREVWRR